MTFIRYKIYIKILHIQNSRSFNSIRLKLLFQKHYFEQKEAKFLFQLKKRVLKYRYLNSILSLNIFNVFNDILIFLILVVIEVLKLK